MKKLSIIRKLLETVVIPLQNGYCKFISKYAHRNLHNIVSRLQNAFPFRALKQPVLSATSPFVAVHRRCGTKGWV